MCKYIYIYAWATAHPQAYEHSKAHQLRYTYTQTKSSFKLKINHINQSFWKHFTLSDECVKHETLVHRHYHVIYIYIYWRSIIDIEYYLIISQNLRSCEKHEPLKYIYIYIYIH